MDKNDDVIFCEPMDIDSSFNSNKMDNSLSTSDSPVPTIIKKQKESTKRRNCDLQADFNTAHSSPKIPVVIKKFHLSKPKPVKRYKYKYVSIISVLLAVFVYYYSSYDCSSNLNYLSIENTLTSKLYGQISAIKQIIKVLKNSETKKLLTFYGGTGVGKTYASSLIIKDIFMCSNVYHYTMLSILNSVDFMVGMMICKSIIIIIDDADISDKNLKKQIDEIFLLSDQTKSNVTLILIVNYDEMSDDFHKTYNKSFNYIINEELKEIKAFKEFIEFIPLQEEHLIQCINNELKLLKNQKIDIYSTLKNFDVSVDGCKGVHSKIKFLSNS